MDAISPTDFITSNITPFFDSFGRCPLVSLMKDWDVRRIICNLQVNNLKLYRLSYPGLWLFQQNNSPSYFVKWTRFLSNYIYKDSIIAKHGWIFFQFVDWNQFFEDCQKLDFSVLKILFPLSFLPNFNVVLCLCFEIEPASVFFFFKFLVAPWICRLIIDNEVLIKRLKPQHYCNLTLDLFCRNKKRNTQTRLYYQNLEQTEKFHFQVQVQARRRQNYQNLGETEKLQFGKFYLVKVNLYT